MKFPKRLRLALLGVTILIGLSVYLGYLFLSFQSPVEEDTEILFYDDSFNWKCKPNSKLLRSRDSMVCIPKNSIFFVESSDSRELTVRQSCAVESASRHHPDRQVWVLMTSPETLNLSSNLTRALTNLTNVHLIRMKIGEPLFGTPLWDWYIKEHWKKSSFRTLHVSDALRLGIVSKYGGLYLDLDVVVLHSLSHLRNTASTDNGKNVANAILAFDPAHPLLRDTIVEFAANYKPNEFAANGPLLLNRSFRKVCEVADVEELRVKGCAKCEVNVLPMEAAYPIPYDNWRDYFKPQQTPNVTAFNSCLVIHVWNKLSSGGKLTIGENSLYELEMKRHCPSVYEYAAMIGYA